MFDRLAREQNRVGAIHCIALPTAEGRWRKRHGRLARLDSGTGGVHIDASAWPNGLDAAPDDHIRRLPLGMLERAATAKLTSSGKRRLKTLLYYRPGK